MKPITAVFTVTCAIAAFCTTASASSLSQQTGLVIVDVKAVAADIAQNIDAQESVIPLTVQAPIDVAAKVCGIPETVLGAQGGAQSDSGGVSCSATKTSPELEQLVRTKVRQQ